MYLNSNNILFILLSSPVAVDAQKDYHLKLGHTEGPTQVWAQPTEGRQGWPPQPPPVSEAPQPPPRVVVPPPPTLPPIVRTPPPTQRQEPPPSSRIPTPTLPPRRPTGSYTMYIHIPPFSVLCLSCLYESRLVLSKMVIGNGWLVWLVGW